jgi:hypothetical protein
MRAQSNVKKKSAKNMPFPGNHLNKVSPENNFVSSLRDNFNPSPKQHTNRHDRNKQTATERKDLVCSATKPSQTKQESTRPDVSLRTNISATKITMTSCHTG